MNISHFVKTPEHKRCVQMLTEGFVESFVDFFYLTHKKDTTNTNNEAGRDSGIIPQPILYPTYFYILLSLYFTSISNNNNNSNIQKAKIYSGFAKNETMTENGTISLHNMSNDVLDFLMERLSEAEDAQREGTTSSFTSPPF